MTTHLHTSPQQRRLIAVVLGFLGLLLLRLRSANGEWVAEAAVAAATLLALHSRGARISGPRAAEQLVFGEATTGAESDLEQATAVARQMVGRWGMSEQVGLVSALPRHEDEPRAFTAAVAQHTLELIDQEVERITSECYARALAATLLERETLDEADAYAAAGLPAPQRTDDHPIPLTH